MLVASSSFNIGTNLKINLDDDKHIEKDKPDIKSKKEGNDDDKHIERDKPDVKSKKEEIIKSKKEEMIKFRPDMNEITYEEEKAALILGITTLYNTVDFQMIYFLLTFVIKYVYFKTPTPVISAHKF